MFQPQSSSRQEVYSGASIYQKQHTMMLTWGEILDFRLSESSKNELTRTFCSPKVIPGKLNLALYSC